MTGPLTLLTKEQFELPYSKANSLSLQKLLKFGLVSVQTGTIRNDPSEDYHFCLVVVEVVGNEGSHFRVT